MNTNEGQLLKELYIAVVQYQTAEEPKLNAENDLTEVMNRVFKFLNLSEKSGRTGEKTDG